MPPQWPQNFAHELESQYINEEIGLMAVIKRETKETRISVQLSPGSGESRATTGVPFLDHMMLTLARYASLEMQLDAAGDLRHHTIEDVAIAMGAAFRQIVPAASARYGDRTIAMDDALVQVCVDVGGRPYYRGPLPSDLYDHWMRSFADNAAATVHVRVLRGHDRHHIVEAAFKALGLALRDALIMGDSVFSTKGNVTLETK
jgi:imidazoleglycerol-phosphate dehydratase